ncbi:MAG TPA: tetratricopeptide repeat protein [Candidatus Cloacimonadota bacterium]|nr:tetratricopeptide repeat protein [Candidatus Cloacimonadota bacterium]
MKRCILMICLFLTALALCAEATSPLDDYIDAPDAASFEEAISYLNETAAVPAQEVLSRIQKLYVLNLETERVIDGLLAEADSLPAGQRFSLGNVLMGMEKLDQAVALYDAINRDYPNWSCPWRHKGEAYYKMGEYEEAVAALTQAIATNRDHVDAYIWMAYALNELGQYAQALENLEHALSLDPDDGGEHEDEAIPDEQVQALLQELRQRLQ